MNRQDVEMLNRSLENMGQSFRANRQMNMEARLRQEALDEANRRSTIEEKYRQSALDEAAKRTQVDDDFRKAQMAHYSQMETDNSRRADAAEQREKDLANKFGLAQATKDFGDAQTKMQDSMATLARAVKAGAVAPTDATAAFKAAIDSGIGGSNPQMHDQLLKVPQFALLYNGQADWSKLSDALDQQIAARSKSTTGAVDMQIQHWNEAQRKADDSGDPQDQAYADTLKANLPAAVKGTAAPKPTEATSIQRDPNGKEIKRTKSFALPGDAAPDDGGDDLPDVGNTPAQPASVPDTRGIMARVFNSGSVPVPPAATAPNGVKLTADDLKPVTSPGLGGDMATAPQTPPQPGQPDGMVRVIHPSGQSGMIPRANLPAALQQGFKLATQ